MPVLTLTDGTALATICPITMFYSPIISVNSKYLPFVNVSNGSSTLPFLTLSPAPYAQAPFSTQTPNVIEYGVDAIQIDFIETESPINVKGRL